VNATPSMGPAPVSEQKSLVDTGEATKWSEGSGILHDSVEACGAAADGKWAEGLLNAAGAAAGVGSFLADPLAGLMSGVAGYLIEHVSFLKEPLDWLTGDQQTLDGMSKTWGNISNHLEVVSTDLTDCVKNDAGQWVGLDVDSYRSFGIDRAETYAAVAKGAQGISVLINISKTILNVVRGIVRDIIAEAVGKLISIAIRWAPAIAAAGAGIAGMIAEAVPMAVKYANKALDWCKKLSKAFSNATGLFKKLEDVLSRAQVSLAGKGDDVVQGLRKFVDTSISRVNLPYGKVLDHAVSEAKRVVVDGTTGLPTNIVPKLGLDLGKEAGKVFDRTEWLDWRQAEAEKEKRE